MIQTGKDKPIVFVSHVEEDAAVASEIKNWLEDKLRERVEVFVSSDEGIKPGDKWEERIIDKLQSCCIALVVCTQTSVRQPWVNFEAGGAWVQGARVIPLCYHGQRKDMLPRPLSSRHALDLSEPNDVNKLLKTIAEEAGLSAPDIDPDPNELMERLPQRNYEELEADGKLPDIRVEVNQTFIFDSQGRPIHLLSIEAQNYDKNSVFLGLPCIAIQNSRNRFSISRDSVTNMPVQTGELKPGDSRSVIVDPMRFEMEDIEQLGEVIFRDKIGREFKGSAEATLRAIQHWKSMKGL
ncbi:TIR domain-containing protein [Candidatus Methanophagaceae archaeon]|nr:TIR domain-containing protein [Methanophagales archaeon]